MMTNNDTIKKNLENSLNPFWFDKLSDFILKQKNVDYFLTKDDFFPSLENRFNALNSTNLESKVKVIFIGQDPYPRKESAIGYAFWDGKIKSWTQALSPSFKNIIKSVLIYEGLSKKDDDISKLRNTIKENNIFSPTDFFENSISQDVVWLNASLTFESKDQKILNKHLKFWTPIIKEIIKIFLETNNYVIFVFLGKKSASLKKYIEDTKFSNYFFVENCHPMLESFHEKNIFAEISSILERIRHEKISWLKK